MQQSSPESWAYAAHHGVLTDFYYFLPFPQVVLTDFKGNTVSRMIVSAAKWLGQTVRLSHKRPKMSLFTLTLWLRCYREIVIFDNMNFGITPKLFEIIERAPVFFEDVNNNINVVK